jgi:hypothetical protein
MVALLLSQWRYIAILGAIIAVWYYGYTCGANSIKSQWEAEIKQAKEQVAIIERKAQEQQNENEITYYDAIDAIDGLYEQSGDGVSKTPSNTSKPCASEQRRIRAMQRVIDTDTITIRQGYLQMMNDRGIGDVRNK